MARKPLRPLIRSGGFYPSRKWTPLVYAGGYTTANGGEEPAPPPIEKTITGNPIHILDALAKPAQALSVELEPVQDLNGYDSPWPAGGGKNLLDSSTNTKNKLINDQGEIVTNNAIQITDFIPVSASTAYVLSGTGLNGSGSADVRVNYYDSNKTWKYRSGTNKNNGLQFTTDSDTAYVRHSYSNNATNEQLELGTTATSYAPYSNICPISGWTGAKVTRTGKNLFDPTTFSSRSNYYDVNDDGSVKIKASDSSGWTSVPIISLKAGTYTISINDYTSGNYQVETSEDNYTSPTHKRYDAAFTFTLTKDGGIKVKMGTGGATLPQTVKPILNIGYTAASYSPYTGDTYSITFPSEAGTVYGGTLDVTTGVLTVNKVALTFNGSEGWVSTTANGHTRQRVNFVLIGIKQITGGWQTPNLISDRYSTKTPNATYVGTVGITNQQNSEDLYIMDNRYDYVGSASDYKTWLSTNNLKVVYELATPQTYQLTPTEVTLLLGENNIWSDGEMTLTYLADGNASDVEALNILLGNRYVNNHGEDEPTDREALDILLGR